MADITLIAPYQSLGEQATKICEEFKWPVEILYGRANRGLEMAREAEKRGTRVIVTRGITAERIRSVMDIPVVELPVTGFDILRAYLQAKLMGTPVGVADEKRIIEGFECLSEILGEEILTYELTKVQEMRQAVNFLRQKGVKTIIGKATINRYLRMHKIQGILIPSGREAVIRALEEAMRVVSVRRQEMAKLQEMKAVLDFNSEGIVAIDGRMQVTAINPAAECLLSCGRDETIGRSYEEVFPKQIVPVILRVWNTCRAELGELVNIGNFQLALNCIPIVVEQQIRGMIVTLQDVQLIQKLERKIRRNLGERGHVARFTFADIVGKSDAINEAVKRAQKYGAVDSTILIYGETGCGKEIFAHAIHNVSSRREGPFVAINCAALPENLLESELFGYVEGAFTGARKGGKLGLFELAHNGTLFMDEIGEMSDSLQARVLRVLEEGRVMRLGADRLLPVDVRIIAATNRNLKDMVYEKKFREDLYYRIHVLTLNIPPLRERKEDIEILLRYFMVQYCQKFKKKVYEVKPGAMELFREYSWPGNVRELKNISERLVLLAEGPVITEGMAREILADHDPVSADAEVNLRTRGLLSETEQTLIKKILAETGGNRTEAARRLGIGRTTLWRKLK